MNRAPTGDKQTEEIIDHAQVLDNEARLTGSPAMPPCPECLDEMVFALRDRHHTFSVGMSTILQCLALAQEEGAVPVLPSPWWLDVVRRYKVASPKR
ncbi:MAG: hypothetical protein H6981_01375 [Gammaproteobacteria bacterium]|nr:hypothetical protein [Gammaproteobacteria bacterium]MCP5135437.1 hypothetical protein [Gammaproteobacteria bacterium]